MAATPETAGSWSVSSVVVVRLVPVDRVVLDWSVARPAWFENQIQPRGSSLSRARRSPWRSAGRCRALHLDNAARRAASPVQPEDHDDPPQRHPPCGGESPKVGAAAGLRPEPVPAPSAVPRHGLPGLSRARHEVLLVQIRDRHRATPVVWSRPASAARASSEKQVKVRTPLAAFDPRPPWACRRRRARRSRRARRRAT
jgi:hypothetical protein